MKAGRFFRTGILFSLSAIWFSVLIPWNGFLDPDAYYHAKISWLLWQYGPIKAFPWLDLTLLGTHFADLHFGFHLFVGPFVYFFGLFNGVRLATIVLSAICVVVFDACIRWVGLRFSSVWTGFLLLSHGFVLRLLLGKATPLAVAIYLIGLASAWKRKPFFVAVAAFAYALSHGGWIYLAGSVALLAFGDVLYARLVQASSWKEAIRASLWRETISAWLGGILGMVLHPNFPAIFSFSWTQVVTIGLGTPFRHVVLGNEWLPPDLSGFFTTLAPWIIVGIAGAAGLLLAARRPLYHDHARLLTSLGWVLAVLVALTLKSRRNIEFLIPVLTFWCAALWSLVDVKRFREQLPRFSVSIFVVCLIVVFGKQAWSLWTSFHPPRFLDSTYMQSMLPVMERARPGDRIFHSSWDEFPILFAQDDRLRYMAGLDPTFLYVASSTLSDAYRDLTWSLTTSSKEEAWSLIHDRVQARFIFVSKQNHGKFLNLIRSDTRFVQLADTPDSVTFELK